MPSRTINLYSVTFYFPIEKGRRTGSRVTYVVLGATREEAIASLEEHEHRFIVGHTRVEVDLEPDGYAVVRAGTWRKSQ